MNTEKINLLNKPKEDINYFYNFNFLKFKKILFPLAIVALLFIIKQIITNNFNTITHQNIGMLGMLNSFSQPSKLPLWAETINMIIEILIMMVIILWEAVDEKKYDKIKIILLLSLPSIASDLILTYSDIYNSPSSSSFSSFFFLFRYLNYYALYGAFRGKILYDKKLSLMGYIIGLLALISINTLYQKIDSVLPISDFTTSLYSYGQTLIRLFIPLSFFYFLFLSDAGFSFKGFIKMPSITLLTSKKFTAHFLFLFTSLLSVHLYFTDQFSIYWFQNMTASIGSIVSSLYQVVYIIFKIVFVYLLFSQLLLSQLGALGRRPLWIYMLSFIPVVNLFSLVFFYRNNVSLVGTDGYTEDIEQKEDRNRLFLQLFILSLVTLYAIYKFRALDISGQNLTLMISAIVVLYIFILFHRIGVWIAIGLLGIAVLFFLFQDIPTGFYYLAVLSYGAIGLYNLHITLFWQAEEYDSIPENTETEENVII
jgi:hypothetical protein